jgi:hypothetical protein
LRLRDNWYLHVTLDRSASPLVLPGLTALLDVEMDIIDKALPRVRDYAGIMIICSVVDQETEIEISRLVGVRVEKLWSR